MSSEKKKELQEQYKIMKPDMGIFAIINKKISKYYLETTKNLKSTINRTEFQLNLGMHSNKELIKDWQKVSKDDFEIIILEQIEYDKDEPEIDYSDELEVLKMIWIEKLTKENIQLY